MVPRSIEIGGKDPRWPKSEGRLSSYDEAPQSKVMNRDCRSRLSTPDLVHFIRQGFLRIEGAVGDDKVDAALRCLNNALGKPGALSSGGAQRGMGKLDGSISKSVEIRDLLFGTDGAQWLFDAFAAGSSGKQTDLKYWWDRTSPQIAIRFPEKPESLFRVLATTEMVERGEAWHTDGLRKGKFHPFSLLVGVCLSDCVGDFQGNLLLWPGRHLMIHSCFSKGGDDDLRQLNNALLKQGQESTEENYHDFSSGVPGARTRGGYLDNLPSLPPLGAPLHLNLKKGDIVLLHPDIPHSGGSNWGSQIRVMVYYRVQFTDDMEGHRSHPFNDFSERLRALADQVLLK